MERVMMKCGCVAMSYEIVDPGTPYGASRPHCGRHNTYDLWDGPPADLEGRTAECLECGGHVTDSRLDLFYFQYRPQEERDLYWCGFCSMGDERYDVSTEDDDHDDEY